MTRATLLALLCSTTALAQTTGRIEGMVLGPDGLPLRFSVPTSAMSEVTTSSSTMVNPPARGRLID